MCGMPAARASRAPASLLALFAPPAHSALGAHAFAPAVAPDAVMLADARAPAVLAPAPDAVMRADARAPAVLAPAPLTVMLADARAPAALAVAPAAVMLAGACPPTVLAPAPLAVMLADTPCPRSRCKCSSCSYAGRCLLPRSPCSLAVAAAAVMLADACPLQSSQIIGCSSGGYAATTFPSGSSSSGFYYIHRVMQMVDT